MLCEIILLSYSQKITSVLQIPGYCRKELLYFDKCHLEKKNSKNEVDSRYCTRYRVKRRKNNQRCALNQWFLLKQF